MIVMLRFPAFGTRAFFVVVCVAVYFGDMWMELPGDEGGVNFVHCQLAIPRILSVDIVDTRLVDLDDNGKLAIDLTADERIAGASGPGGDRLHGITV